MACKYRGLKINKKDNVAVALEDLPGGEEAVVTGEGVNVTVVLKEVIPYGFKFATQKILSGQPIIKYGEPIGVATVEIAPGSLVHIHNLMGTRGRGDLSD